MQKSKKENDALLWKAFKAGDVDAFKALYRQNIGFLLNYGMRLHHSMMMVEDCVQEVFIDLWQYRRNLADPNDVRFYLMKSLRSRLSTQFKRNQPFVSGFDDEIKLPFAIEPSSEQHLIQLAIDEELQEKIRQVMDTLTPRQREIVYLRYFNDMSYEQICELMHINYQTARTQHYNAMKTLRIKLIERKLSLITLLSWYFF